MQSLKIMLNLKNISLLIFIFHFYNINNPMAQQIVEGVVAVVGDKAIFKSEIEQQYLQLKEI